MQQAFIGVDVGTRQRQGRCVRRNGNPVVDCPASDRGLARRRRYRRAVPPPTSGRPVSLRSARRWRKQHFRPPPSRALVSMPHAHWCCWTERGEPLTVSPSGDSSRNVMVWMDHRATAEARSINDTRDDVLRYVGGSISPEMEMPKILWLKRHLPAAIMPRVIFSISRIICRSAPPDHWCVRCAR